MTSLVQSDVLHKYSCRCLNVTISTKFLDIEGEPGNKAEPDYVRAFVGDIGIRVLHHYLTIRTRFRAHSSPNSTNKLIQPFALSCLACNTLVYRIIQEIPPEAEVREGPVVPIEDWVEQETLRSKSGWIEIFTGQGGCLVGQSSIEQQMRSMNISPTFSVSVPSPPAVSTPTLPLSEIHCSTPTGSHQKISMPDHILPPLSPLFPPPPFTPSHPVFVALSTRAIEKSAELRLHAEDEAKRFVQSKLDLLDKEEARLRKDVEGIWGGYREGWKQMVGKVNEERRLFTATRPDTQALTTSAKSGVPMSIRDFSPVDKSQPQRQQPSHTLSQSIRPPSPSLLSASLANSGTHMPTIVSQSPELYSITPEHVAQPPSHAPNGAHSSGSSISIRSNGDARMLCAFRRNMDTGMDIASSVAWVKGEEEIRRRLENGNSETTERARNRTSKKLGIGALEPVPNLEVGRSIQVNPTVESEQTTQHSGSRAVASSEGSDKAEDAGTLSNSGVQSLRTEISDTSSASKKAGRRVTFDISPDMIATKSVVSDKPSTHVPEVELFDLDDLSSPSTTPQVDQPHPVARTPSYKLRANDNGSGSRKLQPASMPLLHTTTLSSSVNEISRWQGGPLKRSVNLADALPLLSSSVPAGDRLLTSLPTPTHGGAHEPLRMLSPPMADPRAHIRNTRQRAPSPAPPSLSNGTFEPAEAELKHLLAASAPSHRHAWREGGRAWQMFHQRSRIQQKAKGAISEEGSDEVISSLDDSENSSSSEYEYETDGRWRNPSRFASSLPVQIRHFSGYKPSLEPKTSLAERQGVLVPPLKANGPRTNSATAFRKAAYAERDRIRSIDPGPTLDFDEQMEDDDDLQNSIGDGERGRRRALSILQARSVVPEAGMWRSMAS